MSKPLKPRRGTTAENNAFVGEAYEITYDTDKNTLVCRDGMTAGGSPLAKEKEVASLLSSLDSSLRAFIAQEVAKALAAANAAQSSADNALAQAGELLDGKVDKVNPKDSEGNDLLTSAGGTLTGALYKERGDLLVGLRDDAYYGIYGCTDYGKGARIILSGKDCEGWNGELQIQACDGTNYGTLRIIPDGTALINGKHIESVEAEGSRYIRFKSGLQLCYATSLPCGTWTFPAAFASPPAVIITPVGSNNSATIKTGTPTTTKVDGVYNSLTWNMSAIAIGWWK